MRADFARINQQRRDVWVESALRTLEAGGRILDAGAGEGRYRAACSHLRYTAQDFARYDGRGDGRGLQTGRWTQAGLDLVCDIAAIPEPDGAFDAVLCAEVLEHVPEPLAALRELARVLRPGGVLLLTVPFASLTHFAPFHFHTGFSRYFFERHLPALGLRVVEIGSNGNYFEFLAQELRRVGEVSRRYTGRGPGLASRAAAWVLGRSLGRAALRDRGSAELLCFGLHVRCIRT